MRFDCELLENSDIYPIDIRKQLNLSFFRKSHNPVACPTKLNAILTLNVFEKNIKYNF